MTETDEEFLARMMFGFPLKPGTYEIGTASLDRLIALALRGLTAREVALEEAASVCDSSVITAYNDAEEAYDEGLIYAANAIRALKEKR
jgi:hypothetical protein